MLKNIPFFKRSAPELSFCVLALCATGFAQGAISQTEYQAALDSARNGQTAPGIEKLQMWHRAYPENQQVLYDLIVVLGWAGDFDAALAYYDPLMASNQTPAYALKSLGYSAAQAKRWQDAEATYRRVLAKMPDDMDARAGLVNALLGQKRSDDALQYVQGYLPKFSSAYKRSDVPMIMLLAQIRTQRDEQLQAAAAYQDAVRLEPQSRDAIRGYAFALDGAGMPYLAERTAGRHPEFFNAEEKRQLAHSAAGTTVGYGEAQIGVDYRIPRFATTDAALQENADVTKQFGEKPVTQFDRMVALRDRQRMTDVVQLYQSLLASGVAIPPYATAAAADAYLYLEQPEMARDLYRLAINDARAGDVANVDSWHVGLAYAYSEAEQHNDAQAVADRLLPATPQFSNRGIPGVEAPNEDYPTASVLAVVVRMYADRLQQAEARLSALRQIAPFNAQIREASADLHIAREQPRAALDEYSLLQIDDPKMVGAQVGRGNALLALNQFSEAKAVLPPLQADYPENKSVQNLARQLDIYDRPVLQITSTFGNGGGEAGAESIVDAQLYSAPLTNSLGDAYRVFSHVSYANGDANAGTDEERSVSRTRVGVGVDYRVRDLTLAAEINHAIENANRTGAVLTMAKDFSDAWHARLEADSNVNDLSAAAFNADVTARRLTAGLTWQKNESRSIDAELSNTHFSDDNRRDIAAVAWTERWISGPVFKLDSILGLAASHNSSRNAVYFNPTNDREATVTLNAEWRTWRRYRRSFTQQVQVFGGRYWQQGFDNGSTSGARYGHEWAIDDAFTVSYGIGVSTHPYDGVREKRNYGYLNLNWAIK